MKKKQTKKQNYTINFAQKKQKRESPREYYYYYKMWVMLPIVGGAAIAKKITGETSGAKTTRNSNVRRVSFNFEEDDFEE